MLENMNGSLVSIDMELGKLDFQLKGLACTAVGVENYSKVTAGMKATSSNQTTVASVAQVLSAQLGYGNSKELGLVDTLSGESIVDSATTTVKKIIRGIVELARRTAKLLNKFISFIKKLMGKDTSAIQKNKSLADEILSAHKKAITGLGLKPGDKIEGEELKTLGKSILVDLDGYVLSDAQIDGDIPHKPQVVSKRSGVAYEEMFNGIKTSFAIRGNYERPEDNYATFLANLEEMVSRFPIKPLTEVYDIINGIRDVQTLLEAHTKLTDIFKRANDIALKDCKKNGAAHRTEPFIGTIGYFSKPIQVGDKRAGFNTQLTGLSLRKETARSISKKSKERMKLGVKALTKLEECTAVAETLVNTTEAKLAESLRIAEDFNKKSTDSEDKESTVLTDFVLRIQEISRDSVPAETAARSIIDLLNVINKVNRDYAGALKDTVKVIGDYTKLTNVYTTTILSTLMAATAGKDN